MKFAAEHYQLSFFLNNGFVRRQCRVCGEFFWTLNPELDVCGESPCVPYQFIGQQPTSRRMSVREARQAFLDFFALKGHKVIKPYPVVARWRTDLYLVHASIVDFQPWATSGIAPPPANPLVISQPCIRMVDIDKVGLTFGRHLTIFEMGGHHAFNSPENKIYWKDETTEYCHEFMTGILGIDPLSITYKEAAWAGGGNAGPCLEVISGGLELATLVFMQYKTDGDELTEIPILTVDTGYGIERLAWFSQGTPSCFDAIYGELYPKVLEIIPVEWPSEELLASYAPHTALVVPKSDVTVAEARRQVAAAAGIPVERIEAEIAPLERLYAALDFTKAIAFIVSEGVVPSNVKAGYLTRLLIRKTYRHLRSMGYADRLLDLLDLQLSYWSRDFPHLAEMRDEVLDIVGHEVEKFEDTLAKGVSAVERELSSLKKRGEQLSVEALVRFYDERGITPDIVSEVAERLGMKVETPENFYELVAARHLRETAPQEEAKLVDEEELKQFPPTRKLYYEKPFTYSFNATVLGVVNGYVILDQTLFYPEGGGQVGDTGELIYGGGDCRVVDTQIVNGVILHKVEGNPPRVGEQVEGVVDRDRRLSIIRHHTATHIMIGTVRRVLGQHAWQAGAKKEPDKARLDIYHHKRLTPEEVRELERVANSVVARRMPVQISWRDRNEAEQTYGFFLYQGGEVPSAQIRVVEIIGWDAEACGGIHCENTEDVGFIKIIKTERIQDGVERLIFAAGPAALQYVQSAETILENVAGTVSASYQELPRKIEELEEEIRELRKSVKRLQERIIPQRVREIREIAFKVDDTVIYTSYEDIDDQEYLIKLAAEVVNRPGPAVSLVAAGRPNARVVCYVNEEAVRRGYKAGRIVAQFCQALGGRGGGRDNLGQGAVPYREGIEEQLNEVIQFVQPVSR